MKITRRAVMGATKFVVPAVAMLAATPTLAADTAATGIDASFITMLGDLDGMLSGNFGSLLLLASLIIAVGVYAITSNWRFVIASAMVAFLIGYGVDIIQGIGGVTATVDLIDVEQIAALETPGSAILPE